MDLTSARGKYVVLAAAVAMQLLLGATYSWAVFVAPLRASLGISQEAAQLPFTVFYFVFPATMVAAGVLLGRLGPARSAVLGGILFGSGWMIASLGESSLLLVVAGIGIVAGMGVGFAYIVPIAVLVRWFPERKGLITGIAVAGFGGGAAIIGQVAGGILETGTYSPFTLFRFLGLIFGVAVALAGSLQRFPGGEAAAEGADGRIRGRIGELVRLRAFRRLYLAMVAGLAAGFAVNANLKELAPAEAAGTGVLAVSLFAVANALGRIVWGALFDRIQPATALRMNLIAQAAVLGAGILLVNGPVGFSLFASAAGFNYGGVLVLYASSVGHVFGVERVGEVYGLLFSANIVAAPAPVLAGLVFDRTGSFVPALLCIALLMLLAAGSGIVAEHNVRRP